MARNDIYVELEYPLDYKGGGVLVFVGSVALSCIRFYRPVMVIVVVAVIVVAVFVNVVAVIILRAGRPPHGTLPPCHSSNGENRKAWV